MEVSLVEKAKVSKAEQKLVEATQLTLEDAFEDLYFDATNKKTAKLVRPHYNFFDLASMLQSNNALNQCITAYEVNIDGTGWEITEDVTGNEDKNQTEIDAISDFFDEPNPRESFVSIRRSVRRDIESTGNGYIEVLRSVDRQVAFIRGLDAKTVRLGKKGEAVQVKVTVKRRGKDMNVTMPVRERMFAQLVGTKVLYYKEYGASRDLNRKTGEWAPQGTQLPAEDRATELIHFTAQKDIKTGYGVPRWINQLPSVLGSRKAEELNLDFFNAGGLPPAMIILSGGSMTKEVKTSLNAYLSGKGGNKNRAAIVETSPSGGSLDHAGSVRVTVERFGAERQQDSMFEKYDERSEKRVRSSFRLPPLFVGRTEDYTFASAFASYMVAEAQVFVPEREEFDERLNVTIMKEIDPSGKYGFRSLPMSVKNVDNQLVALKILADKGLVGNAEIVDAVNEVTNLNIDVPEDTGNGTNTGTQGTSATVEGTPPSTGAAVPAQGTSGPQAPAPASPSQKAEGIDTFELVKLARDYTALVTGEREFNSLQQSAIKDMISGLHPRDKERLDAYVALRAMGPGYDYDPQGAVELCGCASEVVASDGG